MLMKQHSYAFYNGHLSGVLNRRNLLREKVQQLRSLQNQLLSNPEDADAQTRNCKRRGSVNSTDSGVGLGNLSNAGLAQVLKTDTEEMDIEQLEDFEKILVAEIDNYDSELTSRVSGGTPVQYPDNLTWWNFLEYIHFPTYVFSPLYSLYTICIL